MEALTVPPTENKGLRRAGSDLRIQMLQIEQATQRVQSKGKPTCVTAAESLGDVFSSVLILNIIQYKQPLPKIFHTMGLGKGSRKHVNSTGKE